MINLNKFLRLVVIISFLVASMVVIFEKNSKKENSILPIEKTIEAFKTIDCQPIVPITEEGISSICKSLLLIGELETLKCAKNNKNIIECTFISNEN